MGKMSERRAKFLIAAMVLLPMLIVFSVFGINASRIEILPDISEATNLEIETEIYRISTKEFNHNDVQICYPMIEVFDNMPVSEKISGDIKNVLFSDWSEAEVKNYKGVQLVTATYDVSYYDKDVISVCALIDVTRGMTSTEYYVGRTYSVVTGEVIPFRRLNITMEGLRRAARMKSVAVTSELSWLYHEVDSDLYSPYQLIAAEDDFQFFLSKDAVNIIVPLTNAVMHIENGIIRIPFSWKLTQ